MPTVNTVLGPVDAADLKFTLMHEHVMVSSAGIPHTFPELIDRDRFVTLSVQALKEAAADGVNTYVDVTTMDLGRDVDVLERVAEQSEVHIIRLHWDMAGHSKGHQPHHAGGVGQSVHQGDRGGH